ncbi:hypothetical protein KC957_02765, partial [Candidatus Saccharibacteria bacterium]|nr:hypothetical protein [Candidatus Saccharibacteria bacterium]
MGLLGIGGAAALGPIEALGESWSDQAGIAPRPPWVRTVDIPTVEVDWDAIYRYDERNTVRRGWSKYLDEETYTRLNAQRGTIIYDHSLAGKAGYSVRDIALYR